ncbi:uncharacterized protein SPAPADRAFT_144065 [Spathaspora passalidarum NRRL Y-27907]|uniref:DNA mismatch repair protein HSM3 N-terminal domain-containing protein n=1 Tax=Spathaspora passalidarum (strain NRRL Y-27907 / 11-Y1) TaxID=619300 RepID=G3AV79_SPAPN|nr:uncharacterized protein SPAPADRAFT_144065 [Spathaspora passalidarum NRRL Y-27907]EGW29882.1 hypothetical protein SPAPADRAFT_144065 [Spathaspora passalidarum NRRL Y-27907]
MDTTTVLDHLNTCYETKQPIDNDLIDTFTTSVNSHTPDLPQLISIINQILLGESNIDPMGMLVALLEKLLGNLSFKEILQVYPAEFILQYLVNYEENPVVNQLCLKILNLNLHDEQTQEFLRSNGVLIKLLEIYFKRNTPIGVLNQIEKLTSLLTTTEFALLVTPSYLQLFSSFRHVDDTTILARYLDYLTLILPKLKSVDPTLYQFTKREIDQIEDPLFLILLAQFYGKLLEQPINIEPPLNDFISLYVDGKLDELVKGELINVIAKMSYLDKYTSILEHSQLFKTHNLIKVFEHDQSDINLLSKANPDVIVQLNYSVYRDVLDNLSLFNDNLYLPILLNFIKSPVIFGLLSSQFNYLKFSGMSMDKLYLILLSMSEKGHTKEYLFNNLPNVITQYLLESEISNNQLWKLKLEIFTNLLSDPEVVGYAYWHDELNRVYELMKYGKSFRNVTKVDIMDETV